MTIKAISVGTMPLIATIAYILGYGNSSDISSLHWLTATMASMFYSLAVIRAEKIGGIWAARAYSFAVLFPFAWIAICSFIGLMPIYTIFAFLTLPVAMGCSTTYNKAVTTQSNIARDLATRTATLQVMFTVILSAILLIA
jgi:hypothetical protein